MRRAMSRLLLLVLVSASGCSDESAVDAPSAVDDPSTVAATPSLDYAAQIATLPERPLAGQETRVALRITAPSGSPQLDSIASNPVHLIAVNRDLTWYEHRHPQLTSGVYAAALTFPADGEYVLHAILWPKDRPQLVHKQIVTVGNPARPAASQRLTISPRVARSGAYTTRLRTNPEPPATGGWTSLIFDLSRDGEPVTNLTPTGTLGHMVILREGGEDFVYAHSTDGEALRGVRSRAHLPSLPPSLDDHRRHVGDTGPEVTFHTQFPRVGRYKMWVEFLAGGDSIQGDFVIHVGEAKPLPKHVD